MRRLYRNWTKTIAMNNGGAARFISVARWRPELPEFLPKYRPSESPKVAVSRGDNDNDSRILSESKQTVSLQSAQYCILPVRELKSSSRVKMCVRHATRNSIWGPSILWEHRCLLRPTTIRKLDFSIWSRDRGLLFAWKLNRIVFYAYLIWTAPFPYQIQCRTQRNLIFVNCSLKFNRYGLHKKILIEKLRN